MTNIEGVLTKLGLDEEAGRYENQFFIIDISDSNEYAKMYTKLGKVAVNTEYPDFGKNTNNTTLRVTTYFEIEEDGITYNIFLIADFENEKYYLKIGER